MRRLPPLNALRAFEATARLASVTAAAQELGVSHGAVSRQIALLERFFGQKLFDRPGRRVEPTPAGAALLEDAGAAFDRMAFACEQLTRRGGQRILTVNAPPSFAMHWLIPRIASFHRQHPRFELRVVTSSASGAAGFDRPYDLVIRRQPMVRSGHSCRRLMSDAATPVLHPRRVEGLVHSKPRDLLAIGLLHAASWPDAWRSWLCAFGNFEMATLDGPFFEHTALALQAAMNGLGVAVAPTAFVQDALAEGRLVAPFADCVVKGPGFHALFRETAPHERGTRELLAWISREAETAQHDRLVRQICDDVPAPSRLSS